MNAKLTHFVVLLGNLSNEDVLELHRIVSRRATNIRLQDPEYRAKVETGKTAAAANFARRPASRP